MNSMKPSSASSAGQSRRGQTSAGSRATSQLQSRNASSSRSTASVDSRGIMDSLLSLLSLLGLIPKFAWVWIVLLGIFFTALGALKSALDQPTVFTSYETRECVRAETADGKPMTCAQATADRYRNVWIP